MYDPYYVFKARGDARTPRPWLMQRQVAAKEGDSAVSEEAKLLIQETAGGRFAICISMGRQGPLK